MKFQNIPVFVALQILLIASCAFAEGESENLFGDWGGARTQLSEKGIDTESILTYDVIGNVSGGLDQDATGLGNFDQTFTFDTEKLGLWSGGTLFTYVLANFGNNPSSFVGDSQVSDNIETFSTVKLYELWYEQSMFDGAAALLAGLHDYNSEFDSLEYAGGLLNSSFGISRDISQVGPSIFATTSFAVRLRVTPAENCYLQAAAYDGVPGDPNNPAGTHIMLRDSDGWFYGVETGYNRGEGADHEKLAVGFWYHSTNFADFNEVERERNNGLYFIGESSVYNESEDPNQGLGLFLQSGFTRSDRNQVDMYFGGGFAYIGLIPGRDEDTTSFGIAYARNSDDYVDLAPSETDRAETAIELNHHFGITPYFAITPDLQYIINPGTTKGVDDALVLGVRMELAL